MTGDSRVNSSTVESHHLLEHSMSQELIDLIREKTDALIAHYKEAIGDGGLSLQEVIKLGLEVCAALVVVAQSIKDAPGTEKKAAVLEAVDRFYATVIAPIDIPRVPDFVERSIVDPLGGHILHQLASGAIDALVSTFSGLNVPGFIEPDTDMGAEPV